MPTASAMVSVDDRGFLFADACYEVTLVVHGRCIALDRHLARLQGGLDELRIEFDATALRPVHDELIQRNHLDGEPTASVYVQVTRGVAPRSHSFPVGAVPTVLMRAQAIPSLAGAASNGARAITVEDIRWGRVDVKTTGLLPNVLAQQAAIDAGADDVILHRGGLVTEGSHTNVFAVFGHTLVTAPTDHRILAGVTRGVVLELARRDGVPVEERVWTVDELASAEEVLMTSTTAGVRPIVAVDGRVVGDGMRGPVTAQLQASYAAFLKSDGD
ncbi:MAG: aminotransferase class IV [Ilumatobacteraceae bacterium]